MLKKIIMAFLLICTTFSIANADEQGSEISNIAQLNLKDSRLTIDSLTSGTFITNDDFIANMLLSTIGTDNLPPVYRDWLKAQGFTKTVEQSSFFRIIDAQFPYWILFVFAISATVLLCAAAFNKMRTGEDISKQLARQKNKLIYMILGGAVIAYLKLWLVMLVLLGEAHVNGLFVELEKDKEERAMSTSATAVQKMTIENNNSNLFRIGTALIRTNQALMQTNGPGILEPSRWFSSLRSDATIAESLEKYSEFSKLDLSVQSTERVNVDATWKFSNMINFLSNINSVSFEYKANQYSAQERASYGYPATLGKIEFNVSGTDFESITNSSVNDGTLMKQLMTVSEKGNALSPYAVSKAEELSSLLEEKISNGSLNSSTLYEELKDYPDLQAKSDEIKAYIKEQAGAVIGGTVKIDDVSDSLTPEARLMVSGFASGAFFAGISGADNTGKGAKYFLDYVKKGVEARINQNCTENYLRYKSNESAIQNLNSSLGRSGIDWVKEQGGLGPAFDCAYYNESEKRFVMLGSSDPSQASSYKAKAMANKLALDVVMLSVLEGIKQYAAEDKTFKSSIAASQIQSLRLGGLFGYALNALGESRLENTIQQRGSIVSNSALISYFGPTNDLFISTERLFGAKDLSTDDERVKSLENHFSPLPLHSVLGQNFTNLSAITSDSESDILDKISSKMRELLMKLVGVESEAMKKMMGSDPNLSVADGAKACLADPMPCERRPKANAFVGLSKVGGEFREYGFTLLAVHSSLVLTKNTIGGFGDTVGKTVSAVVDTKDSKGVVKAISGAADFLGKSFNVFISIATAVTGAMIFLAYIYIPSGIFLEYVVPMIPSFFIFIAILKLAVNLGYFQYVHSLYHLGMIIISWKEGQADQHFEAIWKGILGFILMIPLLAISVLIPLSIVDLLPVHILLWEILGATQQGLIYGVFASLIAVVMVGTSVITVFRTSFDGHAEMMKRFDYNANDNAEFDRINQTLTDSRAIDFIRETKNNLTDSANRGLLNSSAARRMARQQFNRKPDSGPQNFKTS